MSLADLPPAKTTDQTKAITERVFDILGLSSMDSIGKEPSSAAAAAAASSAASPATSALSDLRFAHRTRPRASDVIYAALRSIDTKASNQAAFDQVMRLARLAIEAQCVTQPILMRACMVCLWLDEPLSAYQTLRDMCRTVQALLTPQLAVWVAQGLARKQLLHEMLGLVELVRQQHLAVPEELYQLLVQCACRAKDVARALWTLNEMRLSNDELATRHADVHVVVDRPPYSLNLETYQMLVSTLLELGYREHAWALLTHLLASSSSSTTSPSSATSTTGRVPSIPDAHSIDSAAADGTSSSSSTSTSTFAALSSSSDQQYREGLFLPLLSNIGAGASGTIADEIGRCTQAMDQYGVQLTSTGIASLMRYLSEHGHVSEAQRVFHSLESFNIEPDQHLVAALAISYAYQRKPHRAVQLLRGYTMPLSLGNMSELLKAAAATESETLTLELVQQLGARVSELSDEMQRLVVQSLARQSHTYADAVQLARTHRLSSAALQVLAHYEMQHSIRERAASMAATSSGKARLELIRLVNDAGPPLHAQTPAIFAQLRSMLRLEMPLGLLFHTYIAECLAQQQYAEAAQAFEAMRAMRVTVNLEQTYRLWLEQYASASASASASTSANFHGSRVPIEHLIGLHDEMRANHALCSIDTYTQLLRTIGTSTAPEHATIVFDELLERGFTASLASYHAVIRAVGYSNLDAALGYYSRCSEQYPSQSVELLETMADISRHHGQEHFTAVFLTQLSDKMHRDDQALEQLRLFEQQQQQQPPRQPHSPLPQSQPKQPQPQQPQPQQATEASDDFRFAPSSAIDYGLDFLVASTAAHHTIGTRSKLFEPPQQHQHQERPLQV